MRVAVLVVLWACGDGSNPGADSAVPDAPDGPAPLPPSITGFGPTGSSACRGGIVALEGTNLEYGGAIPTISGVVQIVAGFGPNFFQITVADGTPAGFAPIVLETPGGTATSPPLEVIDKHTPEVTSNSPTVVGVGTVVTMTGTGLTGALVQVRSEAPPNGGTLADVTASSDTSLMFTVPFVPPGDYFVQAGEFPGCGYGRNSGSITVVQ